VTWDDIENLRDRIWCRRPELRIRTIDQVLTFINRVGFCFAFTAKGLDLPCLWHAACGERSPEYPVHTHHDANIGLVWRAKDVLPAGKKIYYGKAIKKIPSMISLDYFPYFYLLAGGSDSADRYLTAYMRGALSSEARRIMDALTEKSPQITSELKLSSGLAHPGKRTAFDGAMAELQMGMYVVKIAEFYDPFTFLWELVARHFKEEISGISHITPQKARKAILQKYFANVLVASPSGLRRLLGWNPAEIEIVLEELHRTGYLRDDISINGVNDTYWGLSDIK
jgi:hypothetical protein